MKPGSTILITGANGFTGQHACRYFYKKGMNVIGQSRSKNAGGAPWKIIQCDLSNLSSVQLLIERTSPEYVLHLAGMNSVAESWSEPTKAIEANVIATLYLLEALRTAATLQKVVLVTSALEFQPGIGSVPPHPYSLSKTMQNLLAASWAPLFHQPIVIAKPSNLIGPGPSKGVISTFAKKIVAIEKGEEENRIEVSNLNNKRDFLDVRDAIVAYDLLFQSGKVGVVYGIASGREISLQQVLNLLQKETTVELSIVETDNNGKDHFLKVDTTLINQLGWRPKIPFEQSVKDVFHSFRQKH
ncbi:NAD-dependent epimerase/dehydratase family protein [Fictibacillus sp. Mic-4]|uniref:NAD-dependent epimerase/dehydratase family protein n=1 Tax=Fictibacillus TaxID=1329200 RepID=UPI0004145059|nr:NAD-dependent epimerase/dehydratase family protein [Fictibacillus gelatini]